MLNGALLPLFAVAVLSSLGCAGPVSEDPDPSGDAGLGGTAGAEGLGGMGGQDGGAGGSGASGGAAGSDGAPGMGGAGGIVKGIRLILETGAVVDYYEAEPGCIFMMSVQDTVCEARTEMTETEMRVLVDNLNFVRFPAGCSY